MPSRPSPFIHVSDARDFFGMNTFASIGLGLAGAIGTSVARPGLPVVLIVGDGGLTMNVGELTVRSREEYLRQHAAVRQIYRENCQI